MTRQELLKDRVIGSSDAPIIMCVSPWETPYGLWKRRINNEELPENAAMKRGNEMEEAARRWFEKRMGVEVFEKPVRHPSIAHMTATLDGIDLEGDIVVEIKCPGAKAHAIAKSGKVPEYYIPQLQHQIEVTSVKVMYYCSFDGTDGVILEIGRDEKYIKELIVQEADFYECLLEKRAPAMTERDIPEIQDNEWMKLIEEVKCIDAQLEHSDRLQKRREEIEEMLKRISGGNSAKGHGYKLLKIKQKGTIEYAKVPELKGLDLEAYRKKSFEKWILRPLS